jgi:2-dehydropantoate 2-reductase
MACLYAARLAAAGIDVMMLGTWREGLAALRTYGVRQVEADGSEQAYPVQVTDDPATYASSRFALVLVKSWQTERAAQQLAQCLSPDGLALTLQNGLGNREKLAKAIGERRVALGVTTGGATLVGPGRVRPGGEGTVSLGAHPKQDPLVDLLRRSGFAVEIVMQTDDLLWSKLVINAAINPLTALLRVPNGGLIARPSAQILLGAAAQEAAAVAEALGRHLTFSDPVGAAEEVARHTAVNHSSMFQDVLRGAPTEIDAICGAIVAAGETLDVSTPLNRALWLLVKAIHEAED